MAACATRFIAPVLGLLAFGAVAAAASREAARVQPNPFPVVTDAKLGGDDRQTRFIADLSRKIDMRTFTLADPYRVVIDIPQVTFRLSHRTGESGRGLVKAFRYGLIMQGGSRIVLDLTKPARIERAFVLDAAEGQPARLVVDLVATDRESFLRAIAPAQPPPPAQAARPPAPDAKADPRPLIVIDPGHGGIDNGTRAPSGESEKTLVLDFALLLRDHIEKSGKYRVLMTRTDDTFVPLAERVRIARANQAALFISIHADALRRGDGEAQGATIYTLSDTASDAEAARLAEAENRADVIAGINLAAEPDNIAGILIDFAQRETKAYSLQFARLLAAELKSVARLHKHPLKSAGFKVLKAPDVPSVLLELGYVSNQQDLKQLTSDTWRTRTAASTARAIEVFFNKRLAADGAK
ncbi:MAG TPA: N-acetylmuramoyl-L-alanine amidase [Xanthobacteraceae bacterium]|nr:N-acetylmuramoyl-L-alanine amidase [Xanthobacteraceae bacterium]